MCPSHEIRGDGWNTLGQGRDVQVSSRRRIFDYRRLFDLAVRHEYYGRHHAGGELFQITPTSRTAARLNALGMIFRTEREGFSVVYDMAQPWHARERSADASEPLTFDVVCTEPHFVSITAMDLDTSPGATPFHFSNRASGTPVSPGSADGGGDDARSAPASPVSLMVELRRMPPPGALIRASSEFRPVPIAVIDIGLDAGATPPSVPFGGGTSVIAAVAIDANNNPLVGIPVTFATSAGTSVAPTNVKTDPKGSAETTLTAGQLATVTVTASAAPSDPGFGTVGTTQGSVVVAALPQPVPVVTVIPPPTAMAGMPATFTIGATPAPASNTTITSVSVDFGDGTRVALGAASGPAIPVQHVYAAGGSYTVAVTATDSAGGTSTAATVIAVGFQAPASVMITANRSAPAAGALVTLTATLAPASLIGANYFWTSGKADGETKSTRRSSSTLRRGTSRSKWRSRWSATVRR